MELFLEVPQAQETGRAMSVHVCYRAYIEHMGCNIQIQKAGIKKLVTFVNFEHSTISDVELCKLVIRTQQPQFVISSNDFIEIANFIKRSIFK